jgi:glucose-6-phosphate dehydrogenase assembly protein OpcA
VVRALLVPDLPVALLWLDDVPRKGRVLGQLLALSDRVIVDTQHAGDPATLLGVADLRSAAPDKLTDLGWLRLTALRHLVADFFEPPGRAEQLGRLERVAVEVSPRGRNTGLLLLGWLLSRCGYGQVRALEPGDDAGALRWQASRNGARPVALDMHVREGEGGLDGVIRLEIEAGGDTFALHDVDAEHMAVQGPDRQLPRVPLRETDEPGLVALALATGLGDRIYAEALASAAQLVECQQWNQ